MLVVTYMSPVEVFVTRIKIFGWQKLWSLPSKAFDDLIYSGQTTWWPHVLSVVDPLIFTAWISPWSLHWLLKDVHRLTPFQSCSQVLQYERHYVTIPCPACWTKLPAVLHMHHARRYETVTSPVWNPITISLWNILLSHFFEHWVTAAAAFQPRKNFTMVVCIKGGGML